MNKIFTGDCIEIMNTLEPESVNCCVTSPPYWGLRDYGHDDQIGLEQTPEAYVAKMVEVFRAVRRVLRDDGTLWLNLGDTYAAHKDCKSVPDTLRVGGKSEQANVIEKGKSNSRNSKMLKQQGYKNKDLIGIPWRVAFALQADGWYLRQDIIWHKPNPMPESVTDRCTKAHEYIFLLSKSAKYYYDSEAIAEPHKDVTLKRWGKGGEDTDNTKYNKEKPDTAVGNLRNGSNPLREKGANKRSVWTVSTRPYSGAHFATFPPALITPCILAGCPVGGVVLDPFMGAGTTAMVAATHGRQYIGCELNPEYVAIAEKRLNNEVGLLLRPVNPGGADSV